VPSPPFCVDLETNGTASRDLRKKASGTQIDSVSAVIALRNAASHGGEAEWDDNRRIREAFEKLDVEAERRLMRDGIARIGRELGIRSLEALLQPYL
jgi:hypothetical protein